MLFQAEAKIRIFCSLHEKKKSLYNVISTNERSKKTHMEIMKITDNSIKFILGPCEAKEYALSETNELNEDEAKKIFTRLLAKAKKEVGFSFAGESIVAEVFCAKDGGCEIFVSYLKLEDKMYKDKTEAKRILPKQIYLVDSMGILLEILERLASSGYSASSAVYYDREKAKYYIILEDVSKKDLKFAFLGELARLVKNGQIEYLQDKFDCICENDAIEKLSCFF